MFSWKFWDADAWARWSPLTHHFLKHGRSRRKKTGLFPRVLFAEVEDRINFNEAWEELCHSFLFASYLLY